MTKTAEPTTPHTLTTQFTLHTPDTLVENKASAKKLPLIEIFGPTIAGEGNIIGQQTYFLRLGLCDFKCRMCDSMHAVDPLQVARNAKWSTQDEIFAAITRKRELTAPYSAKNLTISGGNPAIHDLTNLVVLLKMDDWWINVETQGTFAPDWLRHVDQVTVSPKGPGMGENCNTELLDKFITTVMWNYNRPVILKVVLFDQRDIEFAAGLSEKYPGETLYLSLGNTIPPGSAIEMTAPLPAAEHNELLLTNYRLLFDEIRNHPILSKAYFLPQWHLMVWGNGQGH